MKMEGDIRVRTHARYARLYNELKNFVVGDSHELFYVCACLGYRASRQQPVGKNAEERFWSRTITPFEWATYYAMLLQESDMDFSAIQDDRNVIARVEEYANAGMEIILEELLHDYVTCDQREIRLDRSLARELPKEFLHFIYDQLNGEAQKQA